MLKRIVTMLTCIVLTCACTCSLPCALADVDEAETTQDLPAAAADQQAADDEEEPGVAEEPEDPEPKDEPAVSEETAPAKKKEPPVKKDAEKGKGEAAAKKSIASANAQLKSLEKTEAELESPMRDMQAAREIFSNQREGYLKSHEQGVAFEEEYALVEGKIDSAQGIISASRAELVAKNSYTLMDILNTQTHLGDIEIAQDMLNYVIEDEKRVIDKLNEDNEHLPVALMIKGAFATIRQDACEGSKSEMLALAVKLEKKCSQIRQRVKDIQEILGKVDSSTDGIVSEKRRIAERTRVAMDRVRACEKSVGECYDCLDACGGTEGALSFGTGLDFALSEEEFVEKWASAIDGFYDSYEGGTAPLKGYGEAMARSAYSHKIDPRLCAAVSIAESSGGKHCIKPHNAWGWGAADSDPYNLASSWDSFDEAIEAWHVGMAESKTGLAHAATVSELGSIYCSSPKWGATVASYMQRIEKIAAK